MKTKIIAIYVIIFTASSSCKDFLTVGPPSNKVASSTIFLTAETATAAVNGLYISLSNSNGHFSSGGNTIYLGLYADELLPANTTTTTIQEFANSKLSKENSYVNFNFWNKAYQVINQSNSIIDGLQNSQLAAQVVNQLLGEALFVRAYCYWNLISLFGDVPLVLTSKDYDAVIKMGRTSISEVQTQIFADLSQAKNLLKTTYPSTGRYRVNSIVVSAFLSRINTYLGRWNDALENSNEVINQSSVYSLETDLNRAFLITSTEAIWQTTTGSSSTNTFEGLTFIPFAVATLRPTHQLQPTLLNAFTLVDKRKTSWIAGKTVSGVTYFYPYKYKVQTNSTKTECQMMIRLAEIYLNRAEAKAYINDATAIDDLNRIRNRAGLASLSGLSGQSLVEAIIAERRLELFAEWGLRFFDLRRTGKLDQILTPLKPEWKSTGKLFPIPESDIQAAPNLLQNPGYN
ncbi:RagB/SusD family nutrient uptake outer membrane protein [Pedobacter sp.]